MRSAGLKRPPWGSGLARGRVPSQASPEMRRTAQPPGATCPGGVLGATRPKCTPFPKTPQGYGARHPAHHFPRSGWVGKEKSDPHGRHQSRRPSVTKWSSDGYGQYYIKTYTYICIYLRQVKQRLRNNCNKNCTAGQSRWMRAGRYECMSCHVHISTNTHHAMYINTV